jgi:hypothetical protein
MKKIYLILVLFYPFISINPVLSQIDTTGLTPLLDWPDIPGASYYQLQIATNPNFSNPVLDATGITQSQYQIPPGVLICNTHYYWRYRAYIGGVWGQWSTIHEFTTSCPVGINQSSSQIPDKFALYQNYPNPFNPSTKIKFDIPDGDFTTVAVYDVLGKEISILVRLELSAGSYEVTFDGGNLASGIYFYRMISGNFADTKKMILIK